MTMRDPNEKLNEILSKQDPNFGKLRQELETLKAQFLDAEHEAEKQRLLKQMTVLREQVDARISFALSA
jgi:hypothetical protein